MSDGSVNPYQKQISYPYPKEWISVKQWMYILGLFLQFDLIQVSVLSFNTYCSLIWFDTSLCSFFPRFALNSFYVDTGQYWQVSGLDSKCMWTRANNRTTIDANELFVSNNLFASFQCNELYQNENVFFISIFKSL